VKEVVFALFQGLKLKYWDTEIEKNLNASIKWLQIDNQTHGSQQPIALYPTIVSRQSTNVEKPGGAGSSSTSDQIPPFFELSIFKLKDTTHGVEFYKYLGFLLQEVSVDVEETLIRKIVEVWKFDDVISQSVPENVFDQLVIPEPNVVEALGLPIYFEQIELNPMKINFSFTKAEISEKRRKL
jgi:vacuolar protein sorting-associated protein 13A/C